MRNPPLAACPPVNPFGWPILREAKGGGSIPGVACPCRCCVDTSSVARRACPGAPGHASAPGAGVDGSIRLARFPPASSSFRPGWAFFSSTTTDCPPRAAAMAADSPAGPAPTIVQLRRSISAHILPAECHKRDLAAVRATPAADGAIGQPWCLIGLAAGCQAGPGIIAKSLSRISTDMLWSGGKHPT